MVLREIVSVDKEVLNGAPVFRNTRVSIQTLFDYLEESSLEEFLVGHPSVTKEQAEKVIEFAGELIHSTPLEYEAITGRKP